LCIRRATSRDQPSVATLIRQVGAPPGSKTTTLGAVQEKILIW
jgi:hypothetical protein